MKNKTLFIKVIFKIFKNILDYKKNIFFQQNIIKLFSKIIFRSGFGKNDY